MKHLAYLFTRRAILFNVLLFLIFFLPACKKSGDNSTVNKGIVQNTLEKITNTKIIRVGYVNFPPIVFKDVNSGEIKGHFVLSIEEIAKQIGAKCQYEEATWATFAAGLQNSQFDISIAPTFGTIPRSLSVAFTRPLMYVGNSAIIRKGETRFHSLEDIDKKGIVVAVTQGEAGHEYAETNFKNAKIVVMSQSDQTLAFSQVLAERADIALGDAYVTAKFAAEHHEESVDLFAQNPYNLTPICWAVRPNDLEFLNFINNAIGVLESTGKLSEHERQYNTHWLHIERHWISD